MRTQRFFIGLAMLSVALGLPLEAFAKYKHKEISVVYRYQDLGDGLSYKQTLGVLYCKDGFIASAENEILYSDQAGPTQAEVQAITGKYVILLNIYKAYATQNVSCFPRSEASYSIDGGEYVIVNARDAKPTANISVDQTSISEDPGSPATVTVSLEQPVGKKTKLHYRISGTAKNRKDYKKLSNKIVIPAGDTSASFAIIPKSDTKTEGDETIDLQLKPSRRYNIGSEDRIQVNIVDNDSAAD
ncbi:Calx-beta domain-containing protein [Methylomonas sp. HYX-M1]|uniref:Calx-beta domain-containing protein n=1 Tax=Methylomonas sp. HYX-M1 TaxID=3139307 RepID=UPI00345C05CC